MKVAILNKSDSTGGAAIVSFRLMQALREEGVDAQMVVCEKLSGSPFVNLAASPFKIKLSFLAERLKIFLSNGLNKSTLFKIDTAEFGLPLWKHPFVKEADAIFLNWVNQGMLSLRGVKRLIKTGKPIIWTMHDMWCFTGICHHAGECVNYLKNCGCCPLLGEKGAPDDLSNKIWKKKSWVYPNKTKSRMAFVAVSNWLRNKAVQSGLLNNRKVVTIPNAFKLTDEDFPSIEKKDKIRILFVAARLDDPIKGLDTLKETSFIIKNEYPDIASAIELILVGNIKDENQAKGFGLPFVQVGLVRGEKEIRKVYESCQIVVSASSYETLPGTLVEAQAFGCVPVAFNQGGQSDIVENGITGFLTDYSKDMDVRAHNLANAVISAVRIVEDSSMFENFKNQMARNVKNKFSYHAVAEEYLSLIRELNS